MSRLLVYDAVPGRSDAPLRASWAAGARVYRALRRVDAFYGAMFWADALDWLLKQADRGPIDEIQYWGHGLWGEVLIGADRLGARSFDADSPIAHRLRALRGALAPNGRALLWLRTCSAFASDDGHAFAARLVDELGARAAGHTYVIHVLQSGLRGLSPGQTPYWSPTEGIAEGTARRPRDALNSTVGAPNTLHFMTGRVPEAFFRP